MSNSQPLYLTTQTIRGAKQPDILLITQ